MFILNILIFEFVLIISHSCLCCLSHTAFLVAHLKLFASDSSYLISNYIYRPRGMLIKTLSKLNSLFVFYLFLYIIILILLIQLL